MTTSSFTSWSERRGLPDLLKADQIAQLEAYLDVLSKWNERLNLTGFDLRSHHEEASDRLLLEPVLAASSLSETDRSVLDIGSGSGSPAIPLLIAAPHVELTMVESKQRKSIFLKEALRAVGCTATIITERAEVLCSEAQQHTFDVATIRGVRLDTIISTTAANLLKPGGRVLYFNSALTETPALDGFSSLKAIEFPQLPRFRLAIFQRTQCSTWNIADPC